MQLVILWLKHTFELDHIVSNVIYLLTVRQLYSYIFYSSS